MMAVQQDSAPNQGETEEDSSFAISNGRNRKDSAIFCSPSLDPNQRRAFAARPSRPGPAHDDDDDNADDDERARRRVVWVHDP